MRITWVTRSFLDYRVILFKNLAEMPDVEFSLLTSEEHTPESVRVKAVAALGRRVRFLRGEKCFGKPYSPEQRSNSVRRVFWQPDLSKEVMATKPDIVITDAFNHWTLPVLNLRRKHHFKHIVCYERTAHTERNAPWLKRKFIQFVGRWVDAVHYNGILCHDFLKQLGYPEYKLKPGNMTVDVGQLASRCASVSQKERLELRNKLGIPSEEFIFLFIGRLIPLKGLAEALQGWKKWRDNQPDAKVCLLLVGEGPQTKELKDFCNNEKLNDVFFAGRSSYDDIPKYLSIADVFFIPTLEDNWSLVVPEAMACGLPIVSSKYNGCWPELVKPENGWVFDPLEPESLVQVLDKAYQSQNQLIQMGEKSRLLVRLYSPEEVASSILRTCRENTTPSRIGFVPSIIERCRCFFELVLLNKVHWGIIAHYRKLMRMNGIPNRPLLGEDAYLEKWHRVSRQVAKEDYRLFNTYIGADVDIVPEAVSHNVVEAILNPVQYRPFYSDKNMFDLIMGKGMLPETYLRRINGVFRNANFQSISEMDINLDIILAEYKYCVIKPTVDSSSGHRVTVFEKREGGIWYALNGEIKGERLTVMLLKRYFGEDFIIQEYLEQSENMKRFCSTSVNTIRMCIYRSVKNEEVVITAIIMRLGHEGSLVDNSHAGGVSIGVDFEGHLGKYATDQWGHKYTIVNGIDFDKSDFQLPNFEQVLAFAKKVGEHLLQMRIANIDVMLDKYNNPRLVEYNLSSMSTWLYQFDSGVAYGKYVDEIIEYCEKHSNKNKHVLIEY